MSRGVVGVKKRPLFDGPGRPRHPMCPSELGDPALELARFEKEPGGEVRVLLCGRLAVFLGPPPVFATHRLHCHRLAGPGGATDGRIDLPQELETALGMGDLAGVRDTL